MTTPNLGLTLNSAPDTLATALITRNNANLTAIDTAVANKVDKGSPISNIIATTASAGTVPLVTKGTLSQTANLFEARNSVDTVLTYINNNGALVVNPPSGGSALVAIAGIPTMIPAQVRGATSQTANLQEWQNSAGTPLTIISSTGTIASSGWSFYSGSDIATSSTSALIIATATGIKPLILKGTSGQTANLQEWQNSSGSVLTEITSNGNVNLLDTTTTLRVGGDVGVDSRIHVVSTNAARRGLAIKGAASQSANLAEFQDSSGGILSRQRASGAFEFNYGLYTQGSVNYTPSAGHIQVDNRQTNGTTDSKGIIVIGRAGQTANLQEWQNSSGMVLASIGASGLTDFSNVGSVHFASTATAGTNGATPAQVWGYLNILFGGAAKKIALYNV